MLKGTVTQGHMMLESNGTWDERHRGLGTQDEIRHVGTKGTRTWDVIFIYSSKILQYMLHLHPTILPNYYTNFTNTTGTGPQGAKDNDYPVAINIKTCKY